MSLSHMYTDTWFVPALVNVWVTFVPCGLPYILSSVPSFSQTQTVENRVFVSVRSSRLGSFTPFAEGMLNETGTSTTMPLLAGTMPK